MYNFYLFYRFDKFRIVKIQTNNKLIFTYNIFINNKNKVIKTVKTIIKNCDIFLAINHNINFIYSKNIIKKKNLSKR